jgi:hypothetical protein
MCERCCTLCSSHGLVGRNAATRTPPRSSRSSHSSGRGLEPKASRRKSTRTPARRARARARRTRRPCARLAVVELQRDRAPGGAQVVPQPRIQLVAAGEHLHRVPAVQVGAGEQLDGGRERRLGHRRRLLVAPRGAHVPHGGAARQVERPDEREEHDDEPREDGRDDERPGHGGGPLRREPGRSAAATRPTAALPAVPSPGNRRPAARIRTAWSKSGVGGVARRRVTRSQRAGYSCGGRRRAWQLRY